MRGPKFWLLIAVLAALPAFGSEVPEQRLSESHIVPHFEANLFDPEGVQALFSIRNASATPAIVEMDFRNSFGESAFRLYRGFDYRLSLDVATLLSGDEVGNLDACGDGSFLLPSSVKDALLDESGEIASGYVILRSVEACAFPGEASSPSGIMFAGDVKHLSGAASGAGAAQRLDFVVPSRGIHSVPFVGEVGVFTGTELLLFVDEPEPCEVVVSGRKESGDRLTFGSFEVEFVPLSLGADMGRFVVDVALFEASSEFGDLVIDSRSCRLNAAVRMRAGGFSVGNSSIVQEGS